jgi:hypothetical protein
MVTDTETGLPVQGAQVSVKALGLSGLTDSEGQFTWQDIPVFEDANPITVSIQAEGFGEWRLQDVPLLASDTLILTAKLGPTPTLSIVPPPRASQPDWAAGEEFNNNDLLAAAPPPETVPLPENIRVRVSGSPYHCNTARAYEVDVINFKQYAKHVLPNEWGALWPAESLRAGAMAVKMYAWYMIARGGKWTDADVWDSTCDQVYNPNFEFASTNAAVDAVWDQVLSRKGALFPLYYRAYAEQCEDAGLAGNCMGQWDSKDLAEDGFTWDQILATFYLDSAISTVQPPESHGYSLRYNGLATDYRENRVLILLDDPNTNNPGPPADVGGEDFTIEWWLKADPLGNSAKAVTCGANKNWVFGNIVLDREIDGLGLSFGVSIAGGRPAFGVSSGTGGNMTLCAARNIADRSWHHIAIERRQSDGYLWLFVDGRLEASADGPNGDLSYPDSYEAELETDPYLGFGAWKQAEGAELHPFFFGWIDELRISRQVRYSKNFLPPWKPFSSDAFTVALYHFDEGIGDLITDSSGMAGGPSHGSRETGSASLGGDPLKGTEWVKSDLFQNYYLPMLNR